MHPTSGSLRIFEQFVWVEVGPSKIAFSRPARQRVEATDWQDERLRVLVLQAYGEKDMAVQLLGDALALTVPGGFIRLFVGGSSSGNYAGLYR